MNQSSERRKSSRMSIPSLITCRLKMGEQHCQGSLRDMSVTGLYIELEDQLPAACPCEIEMVLKGEHSRLKIEGLKGSVIRCDRDGAAIRLDDRMEWFALVSSYFSYRL